MPPVASKHARENSSSASAERTLRTSASTASWLKRLGQDEPRGRVGDELAEQHLLEALLRRTRCDDDEHGQPLQTANEIGEPAQRRLVRPVQIVDQDQHRALAGQVRRQPVEPVEEGKRRVHRPEALRLRCALLEELLGDRGRTDESLASLLGRRESGLEQLADDPVREVVLELTAARLQHVHPAHLSREAHLADERRLPDPRVADDDAEPAGSSVRVVHELDERRELVHALDDALARRREHELPRAERRELSPHPVDLQLVQALRTVGVQNPDLAERADPRLVGEMVLDEPGRRL